MTESSLHANNNPKPEFVVNNQDDRTVADALNSFITQAAANYVTDTQLDIATAYFNLGGYLLLADSLDLTQTTRILLGAEPKPPENRLRELDIESRHPKRATRTRLNKALVTNQDNITEDRDTLSFSLENDVKVRRLVRWLRSDAVEVRRLESRFLHGKAFLISDHSHGVIAGSSNFTYAGLTTNLELNLGNYVPHTVRQVRDWFNRLWDEAAAYNLAALFEPRFEEHKPQLIYLRMLWECYGNELLAEAKADSDPATARQIHLTSFQQAGLWRAKRILKRYNGVLIADEVGLGKTFLAGKLISEAALKRRQRVLVITPAALRDGPWRAFRREYNLPMELISYEEMMSDSRLNPEAAHATEPRLEADINQYAMVVIDEAHNLRNPSTQRARALRRLLAGLPPKKLVLLTATPVNNSLWDLYYQLGYFLRNDAEFTDMGIPSMRSHFAAAMQQNPDDLTTDHLFDLLDEIAVRRTRSFVKKHYANDIVPIRGKKQRIVFPATRVRKIEYDLDTALPGFFEDLKQAINPDSDPGDAHTLTLARYAPSTYHKHAPPEHYEMQNASLLLSGMLKRFESSPHAFAKTCERMANSHDAFLALLDQGRVATADALADWIATDSEDLDQIDKYSDGHIGLTFNTDDYDVDSLRCHVTQDRDLLRSFAQKARSITRSRDPNLAELTQRLAKIAADAETSGIGVSDIRNRRKVLIFSYFADTVDWIHEYLTEAIATNPDLASYENRVASLSGSTANGDRANVIWGFAPETSEAPEDHRDDRYDIIVTTDVLAEGVNLQQAQHIINYDLPWNPMRLVQRHGRIDRIGSLHNEVFMHCVFPDKQLDKLLHLEERLHHKIRQAATSVGVNQILPEQRIGDPVDFADTREQIERIRQEETDIFERGSVTVGALSGEEYRQELRQAAEKELLKQIKELPWGSGSGMAADPNAGQQAGYVFCVRVGDHEKVQFRYIPLSSLSRNNTQNDVSAHKRPHPPERHARPHATQQPKRHASKRTSNSQKPGAHIIDNTLDCLRQARPADGFETPWNLPNETHLKAFEAWNIARADILKKWNFLADKANLEPKVPAALKRASEILRSHPPAGLTQEDIDHKIDCLSAPYPERIVRTVRAAMAASEHPTEQAEKILEVIQGHGLTPSEPPKPRPEIIPDDIHLVCWLALT
ncbi:MAG: helicase-related protein [Acidimicrobiaceae bacterium]|nr:helicase-related protein [Acidimicrobiaceae bacterium]